MPRPFRAILRGLICWFLLAAMAHAHAVLLSVDPADGSLLDIAPDTVHLHFNEAVRPLAIRLTAPDGTEVDLTGVVPGAETLAIPLPKLIRGTQVLSWRVASDDGHPVAGTLIFSFGEASGTVAPTGDKEVRVALWLARFAMTAGLVLGVGGALFAAFAGIGAARVVVIGTVGLGLIAAVASLGLHGLDVLGLPLGALSTTAPWAAAWGTSFGTSALLAALAAVLALMSLRVPRLAWGALVLLAASYAASGHAGSVPPRWLTRSLVFLHVAALTFWIGALIPLAFRRDASALRRFSAAIVPVLMLLMATGAALAVVQLGRDPAQWPTPYGYILAAKLILLIFLLALAAFNRWHLTAPALAGEMWAVSRMRRSIGAELVLALAILGLVAGWRFTPPPRGLAQIVTAPPAFAHLHSADVMAILHLTPGAAGPVDVLIEITDGDLNPTAPLEVTLTLSLPERGIERITRMAVPIAAQPGQWHVSDLLLPQPGLWTVALNLRMSRFQLVKLSGEIEIR